MEKETLAKTWFAKLRGEAGLAPTDLGERLFRVGFVGDGGGSGDGDSRRSVGFVSIMGSMGSRC